MILEFQKGYKILFLSVLVVSLVGIMNPNTFAENVPDWVENIDPELIAKMWVNGQINDDEFLTSIEHLIEAKRTIIPDSSIIKTSQLPDWLVNNAGWWAARILTNSDFDFDYEYIKETIHPCTELFRKAGCLTKTYNSYGFRGDEFQEQKHDIDFRIFAIGGSTTNGSGATDDETWPVHLQQIINEKITGKKIEVINAGLHAAKSATEYDLIKDKISSLDPDLIIMYDGWNDYQFSSPIDKTIQNWKSACELGKNKGFDTIIVIQPLPSTGHRVLTDQEVGNSFKNFSYSQKSQQYVDAFEELDKVCTKTADFRKIFDYIQEPIFWDDGHTMSFGNQIIAENVFSVISPIYFGETYSVIHNNLNSENNEPETGIVYAVGSDLSGRNFDNLNLQNAVFDKADLSNTSFKNTNIDGARFVFANLSNSNLLDRIDLSNINLAGTDLSNISIKGKDLSGANLTWVDLSEHDLTGTNLVGATLSHAILPNISIKGKDLSGANLTWVDLSEHDLTGTNLVGVNLSHANVSNTSIKGKDLSGANLTWVDLSEHDLTGTNLSDTILMRTNLSGMDLRPITLTDADFRFVILSGSILPDSILTNNNFEYAVFDGVDLSGKDLSYSKFQYAAFDNANLEGANLKDSDFIQVDFTKIKNKSLAGADLSGASFAHANLSGVDLSGVILDATNFWKADLSGQDLTVIYHANTFLYHLKNLVQKLF